MIRDPAQDVGPELARRLLAGSAQEDQYLSVELLAGAIRWVYDAGPHAALDALMVLALLAGELVRANAEVTGTAANVVLTRLFAEAQQ